MDKLDELNRAGEERAVSLLTPLIERAPDIARKVASRRPFKDVDDLRQVIRSELLALNRAERVRLFKVHPELAPDNPLAMTSESQVEQGRLNLTSESNEHRARLDRLNAAYRLRFGFPFITALVRHRDMESVLAEFETRLSAEREAEIETAIGQIIEVCSARVSVAFSREGSNRSSDAAVGERTERNDGR